MVTRRLRLSLAALFTVVLVGGLAGAAVPTHHNWNCREVSLTLFAKKKTTYAVCYPCQPDLPEGTPELVEAIWQQEVCAPAS